MGVAVPNVAFRIATEDDTLILDAHERHPGMECKHAADLHDARNTYVIGEVDGTISVHGYIRWTGFATPALAEAFPDCVVMNSVCVWPTSIRGNGIGTKMIGELERHVQARGRTQIGLGVYADNSMAISFYERLGYTLWSGQPVINEHADIYPLGLTAMAKTLA